MQTEKKPISVAKLTVIKLKCMTKLIGTIKFTGRIGEFTYYKRNGKIVGRRISPDIAENIRNKESYEVVRKNNAEFRTAQKSVKEFKQLFADFMGENFLKPCGDLYLHSRLSGLFLRILKLDKRRSHGRRTVEGGFNEPAALALLREFKFHKQRPIRNLVSLSVSGLNGQHQYRIVHAVPADKLPQDSVVHITPLALLWNPKTASFSLHRPIGNTDFTIAKGDPPLTADVVFAPPGPDQIAFPMLHCIIHIRQQPVFAETYGPVLMWV